MKKSIVIFGSTTGSCEGYAVRIAEKLGIAPVLSISKITANQLDEYDNLILGTSTWGAGDLQDDWYAGLEMMKSADLSGKTVAVFGCGDASSFPDTFCGAMIDVYNAASEAGAKMIGQVDASTYTYVDSASVVNGNFIGLALDISESDQRSEERISDWATAITPDL